MWKYRNQIRIRWISFFISLIIISLILVYFRNSIPATQTGMKILLSKLQVGFENLSVWYYLGIIFLSISLMLIGVPSACILFPLLLLKNCTFAFVITCFCQFTSSLIAMWLSYKSSSYDIPDSLKHKLEDNKESFQSFAFWSRLYYNIPLRTIDKLTPLVHNNNESFYSSLIAATSAIMIRICIPAMLIKHVVDQFTLLEPNPELEYSKLLIWAIVLIVYTVLPKIPELIICPSKVKKVIYEIESPSVNDRSESI